MMIEVTQEERPQYMELCKLRKQLYSEKATAANAGDRKDLEDMARGAITQIEMIHSMLKGGRKVFLDEDDLIILGYN